ncbi:MAG: SH3 domain-containing protein [Saccharofermentanales bacterium]
MKSMIHLSLVLCICFSVVSCSRPTNTPGPLSTESTSTVSSLSSTDTSSVTSSEETFHYENLEITAQDSVRVFCEKSSDSKNVGYVEVGEVYKIFHQEVDRQGNLWYQIEVFVNAIGWVPAADCRTTDKAITNPDRSVSGQLLNPAIDKNLLLKLLNIRDGKAEDFLRILGSGFSKTVNVYDSSDIAGAFTDVLYQYASGIEFACDGNSDVEYFVLGGDTYYLNTSLKFTGDITADPGDEILYYNQVDYHGELLVVRSDTTTVIGNYKFACYENERFLFGDFCGDGSTQIFYRQDMDDYTDKYLRSNLSMLFTIGSDGRLTSVLDYQALSRRVQDIRASIDGKVLSLDVDVDGYEFSQSSRLPEHIFLNSKNFPDKNAQLQIIMEWDVESVDTKWYFVVDCIIAFDMYDAYWGLPGENTDFGFLINDLARTRFVYDYVNDGLMFRDGDIVIKYADSNHSTIDRLVETDLGLHSGPRLGQPMKAAFAMLPDAPVVEIYSDFKKTVDGVTLVADKYDEDVPVISEIFVTGPAYRSVRGMRIGDTVEKVESLYGKPDQGLTGD